MRRKPKVLCERIQPDCFGCNTNGIEEHAVSPQTPQLRRKPKVLCERIQPDCFGCNTNGIEEHAASPQTTANAANAPQTKSSLQRIFDWWEIAMLGVFACGGAMRQCA